MKKTEKALRKYYDNMLNSIYYVKGEHDSKTTKQVLAAKQGNYFSPDNCFWDCVDNLPNGTYYVDGE